MLRRWLTSWLSSVASVCFLVLVLAQAAPLAAQPQPFTPVQPRITAPVDDSVRASVAGSRPVLPNAFDMGPIADSSPMDHLLLVMGMSPRQQHDARSLLDSQQSKGSPQYHHWLSPQQFGLAFGPAPQDLAAIVGWLNQQGFTVNGVARSGLWIDFSGNAGQVKQAFRTSMHNYRVDGRTYAANAGEISLPTAISPVVAGVLSLNDYHRRRPMNVPGVPLRRTLEGNYEPIPGQTVFTGPNGTFNVLSPGDFAKIYDLNPLYQGSVGGTPLTGAGETIAIASRSDINLQDVADFRALFGLPANAPSIINVGPDVPFDARSGDAVETTLDAEWAGAVAPRAAIKIVVAGSTFTDGVDLSATYIVDQNLAPVMSVSFGLCEQDLGAAGNQFYSTLWQQAAAQGISVFVASGDAGAAGCDQPTPLNTLVAGQGARFGLAVSGLASTPFNTAVGGTQFNEDGSGEATSPGTTTATFWSTTNTNNVNALGYIPEKAWNESCSTPPPALPGTLCFVPGIAFEGIYVLQGGGGGLSALYPLPPWQTLNVPGLAGSSFANRALPDISLTADPVHDPYVMCFNGGCAATPTRTVVTVGGTSASAPAFAGMMALINQAAGAPQGLANYVLYPLAAQQSFAACDSSAQINPALSNSCVFHDTTVGTNGQPGNDVSNFPAAGDLGYPAATGFDPATGLGSVDAANLVSAWLALEQGFQGTTTTLSSGAAAITATHGSPVAVNVQVNALAGVKAPGGSVALLAQGGTLANTLGLGDGLLAPGTGSATFSGSLSNLPGGSYNLLARYPGDGVFAASSSLPIPVTISPENSSATLGLLASGLPGPVGSLGTSYSDQVLLEASVTGVSGQGLATGSLTLSLDGKQVSTLPLDSLGRAFWVTCPFFPSGIQNTLSCLSPGSYTFTVSYSGDSSLSPSPQPPATTQTAFLGISKRPPFPLFFITDPRGNPVVLDTPFKLIALVESPGAGAVPTGTVEFFEGATSLGVGPVGPDRHSAIQLTLPQGTHNITGVYSGDVNWDTITTAGQISVGVPFGYRIPAPVQTVKAGGTATYNLTLVAAPGVLGDVRLSCTSDNAPAGVTCNVPSFVTFTSSATSIPVTVSVITSPLSRVAPSPFATMPFALGAVFVFGACGLKRRGPGKGLALALCAVFLVAGISACGGGGQKTVAPPPPPETVNFTIRGEIQLTPTTGEIELAQLTLNITH